MKATTQKELRPLLADVELYFLDVEVQLYEPSDLRGSMLTDGSGAQSVHMAGKAGVCLGLLTGQRTLSRAMTYLRRRITGRRRPDELHSSGAL
ncbi:hypothetical protein ACFVFQ_33365 [Streptomyces sp. NPDC057743]|uniref:hypothetical protein n=1 Tax=Streptomyces sp. NPDC057743 TaxID=3346236 RepID=UPI0036BAEDEF